METLPITKLHNEHSTWLNLLAFYADDLKVLQKRVIQVGNSNTDKEVLAYIDFYKNEIERRLNEASMLASEIKQHDRFLSKKLDKHLEIETAADHPLHRIQIKDFEDAMHKLRHELNAFASRWM